MRGREEVVAAYDVFLSHTAGTGFLVERLAEKLERAGVEPWLDSVGAWARARIGRPESLQPRRLRVVCGP
jgi:hypothetical protein